MRLNKALAAYRVLLAVLLHECGGVLFPIRRHVLIAFYQFVVINPFKRACHVAASGDVCYILYVKPAAQCVRNLNNTALTHAVEQKVGPAVAKHAAPHLIVPVIVVRKAPKACFYPAYYDRHVLICLPAAV